MSSVEKLLWAVRDNPVEDHARLVLADWLEEQGDTPRAEFLRIQHARERLDVQPFSWNQNLIRSVILQDARADSLFDREKELIAQHGDQWAGSIPRGLRVWYEYGLLTVVQDQEVLLEPASVKWWKERSPWIGNLLVSGPNTADGTEVLKQGLASGMLEHLCGLRWEMPFTKAIARLMGKLSGLRSLSLYPPEWDYHEAVKAIPNYLPHLKSLTLAVVAHSHDPGWFAPLQQLEKLVINLRGSGDAQTRYLARFKNLRHLELNCGSDQIDLSPLGELPHLHTLCLQTAGKWSLPQSLVGLKALSRLRRLCILNWNQPDALPLFPALTKLEELYLFVLEWSPDFFAKLVHLPSLRKLYINPGPHRCYAFKREHIPFKTAGPADLAALPNLDTLSLRNAGLQPEDLSTLPTLPHLETLFLDGNAINGKPLPQLFERLPGLASLSLRGTRITGLTMLAKSESLRWANVTGTRVKKESIDKLRARAPDLYVSANSPDVRNERWPR